LQQRTPLPHQASFHCTAASTNQRDSHWEEGLHNASCFIYKNNAAWFIYKTGLVQINRYQRPTSGKLANDARQTFAHLLLERLKI
jgi:hypothetical protein